MRQYVDGEYLVTEYDSGAVARELNRPAPIDQNAEIKSQIAALEASQARGVRECLLTGDKTGLQLIEDKIAALRAQLV